MAEQGYRRTTKGRADNTDTPGDPPNSAAKGREIAKRLPAIGYIAWLCSQSPGHKQLFIQDMEWRLFPPVILGQYKLRIDNKAGGLPTAYASWAFLSDEIEAGYRTAHKLRPGDWQSGDRIWLVDCIAPFGGAVHLLEELCFEVYQNREIKLLYPDTTGAPVETTLSEVIQHFCDPDTIASRTPADPLRH